MSIAPNVGSIASHLGVLRSKPLFNFARTKTKDILGAIPFGDRALKALSTAEVATMRFWSPDEKATVIFEEMGFRYLGPIDGHDYDVLCDVISNARKIQGPVLLHVRTIKGKGFTPAETDARTFHGVGANSYSPDEGKIEKKAGARPTFSAAFGSALSLLAERDRRIIGITAAMPDGTGLSTFARKFPERYFDVGIAEAHAVCFAAGAASAGLRPVCAIYSTFLQRAYDQIVHDVVIQNLPVVFCLDRAGVAGDDGPTHMGLYDIAYLRTLPNVTIAAPRNEDEVFPMLEHALSLGGPVAIRYPRGNSSGKHSDPIAPIERGRAEVLRRGSGVAILALGNTVDAALDAYDLLAAEESGAPAPFVPVGAAPNGARLAANGTAAGASGALQGPARRLPTVVNMRFAKPLDEKLLLELARTHARFLTLEEHSLAGGFGAAISEFATDRGLGVHIERIGVPGILVQHDSQANQRALFGLTGENIAARVRGVEAASVR
jgi:1-deoxy-D-xylulose-5-phosphate synthase